jgi:hypothetical protein
VLYLNTLGLQVKQVILPELSMSSVWPMLGDIDLKTITNQSFEYCTIDLKMIKKQNGVNIRS